MALLDIFDSDAFSVHSLTAAVDKLPYQPMRIGQMNLFQPQPITTSVAIVEERRGTLSILPTMPRGSTDQSTRSTDSRIIRAFPVPHVPNWRSIMAQDLEGKRAFGSEDQTEVFAAVVNDQLELMKQDHEVTHEYHRIGAIHGLVLDADGSTTVVNWFTEFGITETEIDFNFLDAGTYDQANPSNDMKLKCQAVTRAIQNALGAATFTGISAVCGDNFFDAFVQHATVRRAYERYQESAFLRETQGAGAPPFTFGGIQWENYRGSIGSVDFVDTDTARFFPLGTRQVFLEVMAPADFVETVNTRGQKIYAKQERMKWDKGIEMHTQSNVLYVCTRPGCLIKGNGLNTDVYPTTTVAPTTT